MKRLAYPSALLCLAAACLLLSCGPRKKPQERVVAVVGNDTLTLADFRHDTPDTALTTTAVRRMAVQKAIGRQCRVAQDTAKVSQTATRLAQQLSLRTNKEWSCDAATSLLLAANCLSKRINSTKDGGSVTRYVDSLFRSVNVLGGRPDSALHDIFGSELALPPDMSAELKKALLADIMTKAFGISSDASFIVADFAESGSGGETDSAALAKVVKGLVYDRAAAARLERAHPVQQEKIETDNSALALKYRTFASIKDSIGKYLPRLEGMYKKQLKIHQHMTGTVMVMFRVSPSG
jgi:hypothetical protein